MAIIEAENYGIEAEELSRRVEVEAAAIDLILNEVDIDLESFEGMSSANALLSTQEIQGTYIGAAGRSIKLAKERLLAADRLLLAPEQYAHSIAVQIYVNQPDVAAIQPIYPNILEILKSVYSAEGTSVTNNPLVSVRTVIDFHKTIVDTES